MKILVVDDSREARLLLESILRRGGYEDVQTADSAVDAFRQLGMEGAGQNGSSRVDLILMDILMSPIDGLEACRRIKACQHVRDLPIIMVSALTEEEKLELAFEAGAVDYVTKPIRKIELLARVRSILQLKQETDQRNSHEHELLLVTQQLEQANQALQQLSLVDALTGIANRRGLDEYVDLEWRRAVRNRSALSLIMIDLDHFKTYNDTYGHGAGDDILRQVAGTLKSSLHRHADLVARYGGEEFALVLPETHREGALVVGETLRAAIAGLAIEYPQSPMGNSVTISVGVASAIPERDSSADELLTLADQALYQSKSEGRNRVSAAGVAAAEVAVSADSAPQPLLGRSAGQAPSFDSTLPFESNVSRQNGIPPPGQSPQ